MSDQGEEGLWEVVEDQPAETDSATANATIGANSAVADSVSTASDDRPSKHQPPSRSRKPRAKVAPKTTPGVDRVKRDATSASVAAVKRGAAPGAGASEERELVSTAEVPDGPLTQPAVKPRKRAAKAKVVVVDTASVAGAELDARPSPQRLAASDGSAVEGSAGGRAAAAKSVDSTASSSPSSGQVVAPRRLSGFDFATWRAATHDPAMRSPMIGLIVLESSPDWDRLVERFDRASRIAPVLRQRVVEGPSDILNPRLVIDRDFDLAFHMRRFRVADPGNWEQVLDEARRQSMTDFDMARPLWRVTLLEGLRGGRAVLIVKLHHAIADGQGAMMLGATTIDLDPLGVELGPMPPAPVAAELATSGFLTHAVKDASGVLLRTAREVLEAAVPLAAKTLTDPLGVVEDAISVARSVARFTAVPTKPMSPLMIGRSINYHFVTFDVAMSQLKAVAKENGVHLNDVFMAAVTGGLRIYHERRGEPVDALRANMPISLRNPERPAQNAVTVARFEAPVGETDPARRMREIHRIVTEWRHEPALHLVDPLAEVGTRVMPADLITAAAQRSDFTASNVPGVPVPVWVGGARVLAMYPLAGTVGAATNITLLSYNGTAAIGVATDDAAIPDRAVFAACLGEGFAEVVGQPVVPSDPLLDSCPVG